MIDLCLRADDADALAKACPWLRDEDGEWIVAGEGFAFDPIGDMGDGRFYANLRCTRAVAIRVPLALRITPRNPKRVWA